MTVNSKNAPEALELEDKMGDHYRYGCFSQKKPDVCHQLGDYLETVKKDNDKARKIFRSTCDDYGFAKSCMKYGNYAFLGKGGMKGNLGEALQYYEKGCELNNAESCLHSGLMHVSKTMGNAVIERSIGKGVESLNKSCALGNANACFYLSGMYISGVEGTASNTEQNKLTKSKSSTSDKGSKKNADKQVLLEKDMEKAFQFAYKACELRNMYACANVGQMYARGDGTEKNEQKAEKFKKMAADIQDELKKKNSDSQNQIGFHNIA